MKRFSQRQTLSTLSEINVTPLLDLAFVLLIIFMITTPLLENQIDLVVPTSRAADNAVDPKKVHMVEINRDLVIELDGERVTETGLARRLEALIEEDPDHAVVVRPHKGIPVQELIVIVDAVRAAGVVRVGIAAQPEEPASLP